jgi:riboflavin kinase/FMN adenylyltransferase
MQVHFGLGRLRPEWTAAVACIGTFDGFHLGHQEVVRSAFEMAHSKELPATLVTFDRHPAAVLAPSKTPPPIASLEANLAVAKSLGIDLALVLPFDASLSRMSADEFFQAVLVRGLNVQHLVVGHDFAFGNGREGTTQWLESRVETTVVPPFQIDGQRVSSTIVRKLVQDGEIESANRMLGRPFEITGFVISGQQLGRTLGFPTVNLARSFDQVLPRDGVYAATAETVHGEYPAALAIGMRPAVEGKSRTIEAFLMDYPGDSLYGTSVKLKLQHFIRPELNFPSLTALTDQMAQDVLNIRELFASSKA